jgi:hypothetical protein
MILVRTDHPYLRVGRHIYDINMIVWDMRLLLKDWIFDM